MSKSRKQHSRSAGRRTRRSRSWRRRWLLLPLALAIALAALYALAAFAPKGLFGIGPRQRDDVDDASRQRLEQVLLDADREEGRAP